MLEIVKRTGLALDCASEELQNDKEVVLAAVKQLDGANAAYVLNYASEKLRNNKNIRSLLDPAYLYNVTENAHPCTPIFVQ